MSVNSDWKDQFPREARAISPRNCISKYDNALFLVEHKLKYLIVVKHNTKTNICFFVFGFVLRGVCVLLEFVDRHRKTQAFLAFGKTSNCNLQRERPKPCNKNYLSLLQKAALYSQPKGQLSRNTQKHGKTALTVLYMDRTWKALRSKAEEISKRYKNRRASHWFCHSSTGRERHGWWFELRHFTHNASHECE